MPVDSRSYPEVLSTWNPGGDEERNALKGQTGKEETPDKMELGA